MRRESAVMASRQAATDLERTRPELLPNRVGDYQECQLLPVNSCQTAVSQSYPR
jgi:hypothetical protein